MIRDKLSSFADWAYERTLDLNVASSFGKAGFVMRARFFEPGALDVDMTGKVCVVSGANAGLGFATAQALVSRGATVYLLCRNRERGQAALERLQSEAHGEAHLAVVDVASRRSIDEFIGSFSPGHVDVLVNNAGVLLDERTENDEGIELTWATNILGAYRLTRALLGRLEGGGRVVLVSSGGMYLKRLNLDNWDQHKGDFDGVDAYANSKRAMVILAEEWAADLSPLGITINSMHPGWVDTAGVRSSLPRFHRFTKSILRDWGQGADTIVWLAVSAAAAENTGRFFFDREPRRTHLLPWTKSSTDKRQRLLKLLAEQC